MKKAAKALFLVGQIFSVLGTIALLLAGILIIALDLGNQDSLMKGVWFIILATLCIANAVMCSKGMKKLTFVMAILNIVFGAVSGVLFNTLGGIFGIFASKNNKSEPVEE